MVSRDNKEKIVQELVGLIDKYNVIGFSSIRGLPSKQFHGLRKLLGDKVNIRVAKKRLILRALEQCKKNDMKNLKDHIPDMPALIFTEMGSFKLAKLLGENKSPAPAKAGQKSPCDIVVPAGKTSFAPGPVIGQLGAVGIKTKVEDGKLTIVSDTVVAKEGEDISDDLASILKRLGIEPMEIGIDLSSIYDHGKIFHGDVLRIDVGEYIGKLVTAKSWAVNLAFNAGIPIAETVILLLTKAKSHALNLAYKIRFMTDETKDMILQLANSQAFQVAKRVHQKDENALSKELAEQIVESIIT